MTTVDQRRPGPSKPPQRGYLKLNAATASIATSRASSRPIASPSSPSNTKSILRASEPYLGQGIVLFELPFGSSVATNWMI